TQFALASRPFIFVSSSTFSTKQKEFIDKNITEIYVEKYHEDLKLLHNLIENKINKEKEERTDKLNETREEIPVFNTISPPPFPHRWQQAVDAGTLG
ncbi:hypothetical protein ACUWCL_28705, partial [Klebsiella pneumoniae]|uniref:hypothetical protein n=1 Tax=Klebsiella pneumoniae TaxID=573 RepID=UPI00405570C9